jgi:hypothetical protein
MPCSALLMEVPLRLCPLTCMTGPGICRLAVSRPLWNPSAVTQNFLKQSEAFRGQSPHDLSGKHREPLKTAADIVHVPSSFKRRLSSQHYMRRIRVLLSTATRLATSYYRQLTRLLTNLFADCLTGRVKHCHSAKFIN